MYSPNRARCSVKKIREAGEAELATVVGPKTAALVRDFLRDEA